MLSHNLTDNIPDFDGRLTDLALQLKGILRDVNLLRYPDHQGTIPADRYSRDNATQALQITNEVLQYVSWKYFPNEYEKWELYISFIKHYT